MFTKILNKVRGTKPTSLTTTTVTPAKTFLYSVTLPGEEAVLLRAMNQVEVKAFVRDAHNLKRLPAGTIVERVS
jgi:hypothetical protein